jgi:hypothetical protein
MLRQDLERLLRETTLTTLAFAIALGWSLYQVASGLGGLIVLALQNSGDGDFPLPTGIGWTWDGHIFEFQPLLQGLIEFALVLAVVLLVRRRARSS